MDKKTLRNSIYKNSGLTPPEKMILLSLAERCKNEMPIDSKLADISGDTGYSMSTVQRAIRSLLQKKCLTVTHNFGFLGKPGLQTGNSYTLCLDGLSAKN